MVDNTPASPPARWRSAQPQDDAALRQLWTALNAEDVADIPPPPEFMERSLRTLRQFPQRGRFVVLEADEQVQGYALLVAFWSTEQGGEVCVVDELYVCANLRRRGHARTLLHSLIQGSAVPQLWLVRPMAIELEVSPDNVHAAALYRSLGFVPMRNGGMRCMRA